MDDYDLEPSAQEQGFFSSALDRVNSFLAPVQDFSQTPVGSQLFEAIYQFGRGKIDQAREKAVGAFLMTSEGRKAQKEGVRQTAMEYAPFIIIAVVAVISLFLMSAARRR
jgi:hypothetical protein